MSPVLMVETKIPSRTQSKYLWHLAWVLVDSCQERNELQGLGKGQHGSRDQWAFPGVWNLGVPGFGAPHETQTVLEDPYNSSAAQFIFLIPSDVSTMIPVFLAYSIYSLFFHTQHMLTEQLLPIFLTYLILVVGYLRKTDGVASWVVHNSMAHPSGSCLLHQVWWKRTNHFL